jgi:glycosidase
MAACESCHFFFYIDPMKTFTCLALLVLSFWGCTRPKEQMPAENNMQKSSNKIVIYQMMTRLFGNKVSRNKMYGTLEENGVGKFNDITESALRAIKELGVTHVWYTGVLEHALLTDYSTYGIPPDDADIVKGRAGSPYAIKDYYDVDPDLAVNVKERMKEFEALVDRTHQEGLKVIIDFVPNHVARAYRSDAKPEGVRDLGQDDDSSVSFRPDNNFYYLPGQSFRPPAGYQPFGDLEYPTKDGKFEETPAKASGNDAFTPSPDINSWFETVKLNYGVDIQNNHQRHFDPIPNTWIKMRDILLFWAQKKVDGFRCDMAEMVPVEFWQWVIPQVREANPSVIFIAEIYNPERYRDYILKGRFDFLYDKVMLYDTLRLLVNGHSQTPEIENIQKHLADIDQHMLHFLENHDEQRIASRYFAGGPWKALPAMVISATIDRGPVMIYFGQEVGEPGNGAEGFQSDDGRTTIFDYWGVPEHQKWMNGGKFDGGQLTAEQKQLRMFYGDLLTLASRSKAISQGKYLDITSYNIQAGNFSPQVQAYLRYNDEERFLIVVSFNDHEQEIQVQMPPEAFSKMGMDGNGVYIGRDMIWREIDIGFDKDRKFGLRLKPYSCFIFKIK